MTEKEWTIMVYMAGDNNLSEEMIRSINEIRTGSAHGKGRQNQGTLNVDFVVQYDGQHPNVKTRRYFDFFDPDLPFEKLKQEEEKLSIEAKIKEFVIYSIEKKPAKKYALILSGHTDAFQGRTLLADENPPGVATIEKLRTALKEIVDKQIGNKPAGENLKILGFDSCVMNTFEIMYEFKGIADVWVGSQGSIPNYTWDYRSIALELVAARNPSMLTTEFVAKTIVQKTKVFNKEYAFGGRSIDISASRLANTEELENGIGKLAEALLELIVPLDSGWHKLILRMLLNVHWKCQTFMLHQSIDLKDFCINLKEECDQVKTELDQFSQISEENDFFKGLNAIYSICDRIICEIEKMVFAGSTTGLEYRFSNGISLFFPWSILAFVMSSENYYGEVFKNKDTEKFEVKGGLRFPKTENGFIWLVFIAIVLLCTTKEDTKEDTKIILSGQKKASLPHFENNSFSQKINFLINIFLGFLSETTGHRDDRPRSRGDNVFASYFGEIKNLGLELDLENDFKTHCPEEAEQ